MNPALHFQDSLNRRLFLRNGAAALSTAALSSLFASELPGASPVTSAGGLPGFPNFQPKAKRVIYLFQSGAPSQMDLFDPKPQLAALRGADLPDSIRQGQRLTGMTST